MQPRFRVLAVSLAAALTLVSAGCGTEGKGDDSAAVVDEKGGSATTLDGKSSTTNGDEPTKTTTTVDESDGSGPSVGGDGGPYVEAMKRSMHASNDEDFQMSDDQIDCISPRFIDIIGVDRLEANGVTPADIENDEALDFSELDMSEKEGNALYDTFGDCDIDLREMMLTSMADDDDMTPEMKTCMEGVFTDDNLRKLLVSTMIDGDDALDDDPLMAQLMGCAFMGMGEAMSEDGTSFDLEE